MRGCFLRIAVVSVCIAVIVAMTTAVPPSPPQPGMTLEKVIVVHRHGARTPVLQGGNASGLCPSIGCGILTATGKLMLNQLGSSIRAMYNESLFVPKLKPNQPWWYYDPAQIVSRSTDVDRTIESAGAFVAGLFNSSEAMSGDAGTAVYPAIATRPLEQEISLLVWEGWPSLMVWSTVTQGAFFETLNQQVETFLSKSQLSSIAEDLPGLAYECTPTLSSFYPASCAIDAEDFLTSTIASKGLAEVQTMYPQASQLYPLLLNALETYNRLAMGEYDQWTDNGTFFKAMGTFGYPLAMDILNTIAQPNVLVGHFSGHDVTLMPLYNTLGNTTLYNPVFAAAMVFEIWAEEGGNGELFVTAKTGEPEGWMNGPSSGETYRFDNFTLQCAYDNGTVFSAPNGCSVKHWTNYLHTRGPSPAAQTVGGGPCYLPDWLLEPINCTTNATTAPPEVSYCHYYRNLCLASCGPSKGMTWDMQCVSPQWQEVGLLEKGKGEVVEGEKSSLHGRRRIPQEMKKTLYERVRKMR